MLFGSATNSINITSNIVLIKNNVIMMIRNVSRIMQSEKKTRNRSSSDERTRCKVNRNVAFQLSMPSFQTNFY